MNAAADPCPCGSGPAYDECCGRLHRGEAVAATAEQLMRSRYSAFAVGDQAYLVSSWHPTTRPRRVALDPALRWVRLDVLASSGGGFLDAEGTVDFRAHWVDGGRTGSQDENSRFVRHENRWTYVGPV